jgi:predicted RNA binding protein YcfA (HicA-like mRNA interferase family)
MAQQVPSLRAAEVISALERCGLERKRQTGSHVILTKRGLRRPVVVPLHRKELPSRTVKDIISQAGLTIPEFLQNL